MSPFVMRAMGFEPEKILTREVPVEPRRTYATPEEREKEQIRLLGLSLKENLRKELLASMNSRNPNQ